MLTKYIRFSRSVYPFLTVGRRHLQQVFRAMHVLATIGAFANLVFGLPIVPRVIIWVYFTFLTFIYLGLLLGYLDDESRKPDSSPTVSDSDKCDFVSSSSKPDSKGD